jgi:hypothetical protein
MEIQKYCCSRSGQFFKFLPGEQKHAFLEQAAQKAS